MGSKTANERDGFWLKHHEAQQASGKDAKAYAAAVGISVQALYQGRKRLREKGLRAPGRPKATTVPRFSKVGVAAPGASAELTSALPSVIGHSGGGSPLTIRRRGQIS